ncbi:hypothetical protein IJ596_05895 [bacterium]|nr:hypothetical protein [bacterium]
MLNLGKIVEQLRNGNIITKMQEIFEIVKPKPRKVEKRGLCRALDRINELSLTKKVLDKRVMDLNRRVAALTPSQYQAFMKRGMKI